MKTQCPNCACVIDVVGPEDEVLSCPSCGSRIDFLTLDEATVTFPREAKRELAHFQLIESLGFGQYGRVWKARDVRLDRMVAVKVPHHRFLEQEERSQALREAQSAAQLHHPNIVQVFEVIETDSVYIVSQLVDGASLKDVLPKFEGDFRKVAELCAVIGRALDYAHNQGIVHRDLKPANILINMEGKPLLTDFGLAKRDGAEMTIAVDGQALGTPAYMSPEQASGQATLADRRSDVYSLGVILYELIAGRRPFQSSNRRALLLQVRMDEPKDPRKFRKDIPVELAAICLKALEKKADHRYSTAADMAIDLERYLAGEPISVKPWPWHRRLRAVAGRHKAITAAIAATIITAALVGMVVWQAARPARLPPDWYASAPAVRFTQVAPGTKIVMFRLDQNSGLPTGDAFEFSGEDEQTTKAPPGMYRVTAYRSDSEFQEVLRTIPANGQDLPIGYLPHQRWVRSPEGIVTLPPIKLFDQSTVTTDMIRLTGGELVTRMDGENDVYRLPDQWVQRNEQLHPKAPIVVPGARLTSVIGIVNIPFVQVSWHEAVAYAESRGCRVMDEPTYEYAKQLIDRGVAPGGLRGIDGGCEEWVGPAKLVPGRCVIRGAERRFVEPFVKRPDTSFRCVRSNKPSLVLEDVTLDLRSAAQERRFDSSGYSSSRQTLSFLRFGGE